MLRDKIVSVVSCDENPSKWFGTGTLVAPGRILTAWHVVFDDNGKEKPSLGVRLEGQQGIVPASLKWAGSKDLDVAVLEANVDHKPSEHVLLLLSAGTIRSGTEWHAEGYPAVRDKEPSTRLEQVRGKACPWTKGNARLVLNVDAPPDKFNGLSGAAVVIDDRITGVVRAVPVGWDRKCLEATPVGAFLDHPEFRKAIGLDAEDDKLVKDLEALENAIAKRLELASGLRSALAAQFPDTPPYAADLARSLVHSPASDVATLLADLDASLDKDRDIVRALLWQALPLAVDWRAVLLMARQTVRDGTNAVELPLRTETIAEIILAGVDGRSCQFAIEGAIPQGAGRVPLPPSAFAPLFNDAFVDEVVMHLCREQEPLMKTFAGLKNRFPKPRELAVAVEVRLKNLARKNAPNRLPHYLLFIDEDLRHDTSTNLDSVWAIACQTFGKVLPSLRLVRLKGGPNELANEAEIYEQIQSVLQRRG